MREWIPVPGTAKSRLVEAAIHQFEMAGYEAVNVTELAAKASVTTGALYHHFDSKLGLYLVVREEMERRVVDRMVGAAAASSDLGRATPEVASGTGSGAAARSTARAGSRTGSRATPQSKPRTAAQATSSAEPRTAAQTTPPAEPRTAAQATSPAESRVAMRAALLVAFDAAVHFGVCRILAEPLPVEREDPVEAALHPLLPKRLRASAAILAAAWRAALLSVADGLPSTAARESLVYVLQPD